MTAAREALDARRRGRGPVGPGRVQGAVGGPALLPAARGGRRRLARGAARARRGRGARADRRRGRRRRRPLRAGLRGVARGRRARSRRRRQRAGSHRRRAGADGARRGRPRVRHRAGGGRRRGQLPEPHAAGAHVRPAVLQGPVSRSARNRLRLEDERRLFRMVLGRARRRVVLVASDAHADDADRSARSRFVDECGVAWTQRAGRSLRGAGVRGRGRRRLASHARRPRRADGRPASPRSTAWSRSASTRAGGGSSVTGPTPADRCTTRSASPTRSSPS